jgi:hypothetical protein
MINGRWIKTGIITSMDGNTYFDLDNSEIGGTINFKDGLVSGNIGIGNKDGINAGMSGMGNNDTDVRIWAGATKEDKEIAPFRVLQDGSLVASKAQISGQLSIPFTTLGLNQDITFNLDNYFNVVVWANGATRNVYLPNDIKYNGVTCTIINDGWTYSDYDIIVRQSNGNSFLGYGTSSAPIQVQLLLQQIKSFICFKTDANNVSWAVLNP